MQERRLIYTPDMRLSETVKETGLLEGGFISSMCAPLLAGGEVIGTLNVGRKQVDAYRPRDETLLLQVASLLASSLENRRLLAQFQQSLRLTENLFQAERRINEASHDLQEVVAAVLEGGPLGGVVDRAILGLFEFGSPSDLDPDEELAALVVAANWHNGQGPPVTPVGTRYPRQAFTVLDFMLSAEPIFFDDAQHDERMDPAALEILKQQKIKALAVLPLWVGRWQIGVLIIESSQAHHFTEREIQPYLSLSRQMAVAVQNKRLLEEAQARARREQILREVTTRVRAAADVDTVIRTAVQEISRTLDRSSFIYLGGQEEQMSREGWQSFQHQQTQTPAGYLFDQTTIRSITPEELEDGNFIPKSSTESPGSPSDPAQNRQAAIKPMAVRGEVIGQIGLVVPLSEEPLAPADRAFLEAMAEETSEALERARLLEQAQKRAVELEAVAQVGTIASTTLEVERLLQTVVDLTKDRFGLYHAHIYLLDEAENALILAAGAGEAGRQMVSQGWRISLQEQQSFVAQTARTGAGVIVNNVRTSPGFLANPLLPDTQSELAVPLLAGERVLGVLDVQADLTNRFTDEDVQIQTTLATQVAAALENARLFEQAQQTSFLLSKRVKELDLLNEIGRKTQGTPPTPDFLAWLIERIPSAFSYPQLCLVAIKFEEQLYGDVAALDQPAQITQGLRVGEQLLGRIYIAYSQKRDFLDEESALLGGINQRVSSYIEGRRLFEQTQAALAQAEAAQRRYTVQVWEAYQRSRDVMRYEQVRAGIKPLADRLPPEVAEAAAKKETVIVLPKPGLLNGPSHDASAKIDGAVSADDAWSDKMPETFSDDGAEGADGLPEGGKPSGGERSKSGLIVPLAVRDEIIGVLGLEDIEAGREWSPEEIALVETIATQLAEAAESLRLVDETQKQAARERQVNDIGEKIQAAQSLEEALQIAVKEVGLSLKAPQTRACDRRGTYGKCRNLGNQCVR